MAFELKTITEEDLPFIFPEVHDETLSREARLKASRDYFYGIYQDANKRKEIVGKRWIVDKERCAFMTCATVTYLHNVGSSTYFFGWEGGGNLLK